MKKAPKKVTIEDLAIMTQQGFATMDKKMMDGFFAMDQKMEKGFLEVNTRLDRIENVLINGHENRIERLEDRVEKLMNMSGR